MARRTAEPPSYRKRNEPTRGGSPAAPMASAGVMQAVVVSLARWYTFGLRQRRPMSSTAQANPSWEVVPTEAPDAINDLLEAFFAEF